MAADRRPTLDVIQGGASPPANEQREIDTRRTHDLDAEDAVIGALLVDDRLVDDVASLVRPEYFHSETLRLVYAAILELRAEGRAIDLVAVGSRLREQGRIAQVGGSGFLTDLANGVPAISLASVCGFAKTVRNGWARREFRDQSRRVAARCEHDGAAVEELLAETRGRIDTLEEIVCSSEKRSEARPVVDRMWADLRATAAASDEGGSGRGRRPTGFARLDELTAGLHSELVILGARPGMGKTALASGIAANVAARGEGVYFASLETIDTGLMERIVCSRAGVDLHRCRGGVLSPPDWAQMTAAAEHVASLPLWIDDRQGMTVAELRARCRRAQVTMQRDGTRLGLVVVDYVQLLRARVAGMRREEVVSENVRALKALATELEVTVLGLAQLNRELDKRADRRPMLSDLRESGELEQCARTVILLYRDDYYRRRDIERGKVAASGLVEVNVAKQNNGPTGMVRLRFEAKCLRFSDVEETPDQDDDGERAPVPSGARSAAAESPRGGLD